MSNCVEIEPTCRHGHGKLQEVLGNDWVLV